MQESAPQPQPQPKPVLKRPPGYEGPNSQPQPMLQKPPGFRDPNCQPPPRKPVLPPSFRPKSKRRGCCRVCCCTFCIILLILLLLLVIAAGIFYLIYEPALPEFHLGSFRVSKLNVSDSSDGAYLNADTAARVEVKNRSGKMSWQFGESKFSVSADNGDLSLGSSKVAGFTVKENDLAQVKAETKVRRLALDERQRRKLKSTVESKALIPTVEVQTKTGVGLQGWNSPSIAVTVVCGGVTMKKLEKGDPPRCSITLLKWIKV